MPKNVQRKIYDDEGNEMLEGDLAIVNGEHERVIYFDDEGQIRLENWNMDEDFIFSIRRKSWDDRYGDLDDPDITPKPVPTNSPTGKYR